MQDPKSLAIEAKLKAHECRELAKRATKDSHRVMLEQMAETWERIANEIPSDH